MLAYIEGTGLGQASIACAIGLLGPASPILVLVTLWHKNACLEGSLNENLVTLLDRIRGCFGCGAEDDYCAKVCPTTRLADSKSERVALRQTLWPEVLRRDSETDADCLSLPTPLLPARIVEDIDDRERI